MSVPTSIHRIYFYRAVDKKPASFSVGGQMEELEKALSRLNGDID